VGKKNSIYHSCLTLEKKKGEQLANEDSVPDFQRRPKGSSGHGSQHVNNLQHNRKKETGSEGHGLHALQIERKREIKGGKERKKKRLRVRGKVVHVVGQEERRRI